MPTAEEAVAEADDGARKAVDEAKAEAKQVIEEARADAERIAEQLRAQADVEAERHQGARCAAGSVAARPADPAACGRNSVPNLCASAGELVRGHVADPEQQSATVDRFLDELDAMAPSERGHRDRVIGEAALGEPARRWPHWSDRVRRGDERSRHRGLSTLADELAVGGQAAVARDRR